VLSRIKTLRELKSIEVNGCEKLKHLFWYSLVRDLPLLEPLDFPAEFPAGYPEIFA